MLACKRPVLSVAAVVAVVWVGCGGASDPGPLPDAPEGLSYAAGIATYTVNVPIQPNTPTLSRGVAESFAIDPALPTGLTLDTVTGVISGTPTALAATAGYAVTARNSMGETTAMLVITVNNAPPSGIAYGTNPASYPRGTAIVSNVPSSTGGAIAEYTIAPALPSGLSLHATTGVISGTPTSITPTASYLVTGSNPYGSTQVTLVLTVTEAPPTGLAYARNPASYTLHETVWNTPTHGGGPVSSYVVSPLLPAGLLLNPSTGVISGYPSALASTADYTITATGAGGSTQVVVRIAVPSGVVPTGDMALARNGHSATLLQDGTVLIAGGTGNTTAELYHPDSGTFSTTFGSMPLVTTIPRSWHTATRLPNGKVLIAGGNNAPGVSYYASAELFDPASGSFTSTGPMTGARAYHTATLLSNGKVLIAGGRNSSGELNTALLYDPALGTFATTGVMLSQRADHSAALLSSGKVLIAGGLKAGSSLGTAELYDPAGSGTFTSTVSMYTSHSSMRNAALTLPSGKVVIMGSGTVTELFDPAVPAFTRLEDHAPGAAAAVLPDGRIFTAGRDEATYDDWCSIFLEGGDTALLDPAPGNHWSYAGEGAARLGATATTLANGRVLIAGGVHTEYLPGPYPGCDIELRPVRFAELLVY